MAIRAKMHLGRQAVNKCLSLQQIHIVLWFMVRDRNSVYSLVSGERAGHLAMKWRGSSGSEWQSLQVGLLGWLRSFLHRKRLASASSPSHPTRRRMRKLFLRVAWVSWRVTVQCGAGLPIGKSVRPYQFDLLIHK